jgi:hypothetical protein
MAKKKPITAESLSELTALPYNLDMNFLIATDEEFDACYMKKEAKWARELHKDAPQDVISGGEFVDALCDALLDEVLDVTETQYSHVSFVRILVPMHVTYAELETYVMEKTAEVLNFIRDFDVE